MGVSFSLEAVESGEAFRAHRLWLKAASKSVLKLLRHLSFCMAPG